MNTIAITKEIKEQVQYLVTMHKEKSNILISKDELKLLLLNAWGKPLEPILETEGGKSREKRRGWGQIVDRENILTPEEKQELRRFIKNECLSSNVVEEQLKRVILREDGSTGYSSYWTCRIKKYHSQITAIEGVIVLNIFYLKTLEIMKEALAHNYGHHFTLCYLIAKAGYAWTDSNEFARCLEPYYKIRNINPAEVRTSDVDWDHNILELLAEDYVYFFTPLANEHKMKHLFGYPSPLVKEFILELRNVR